MDAIPKLGRARNERGELVRYMYSGEGTLESSMQRKRRIDPFDLQVTRNGIGVARPGDNLIANPEYQADYFKQKRGDSHVIGANWGTFKAMPAQSAAASKSGGTKKTIRDTLRPRVPDLQSEPPAAVAPRTWAACTTTERAYVRQLVEDMVAVRDLPAGPGGSTSSDSEPDT